MKKILLLSLFLGSLLPLGLSGALTLVEPHGGESLPLGSMFTIRWTAPAAEGTQQVAIFLGEQLIADSSVKSDGSYNWTVGRLKNGSFVPPGHYSIVLESLDGDAFGNSFTIILVIPDWLKKINKLEYKRWPECPMCFNFDLRNIKAFIVYPKEAQYLQLFQDNKLLVKLGQLGGGALLPDSVELKLQSKKSPLLQNMQASSCELRLFDSKGNLLGKQPVKLIEKGLGNR